MTESDLEWRQNQKEQVSHRERKKYDSDQLIQKNFKKNFEGKLKQERLNHN